MKIVCRLLLLPVLLAMTACATGLTAFDKGQQLERSKKYDEAVRKYAEAVASNPDLSEYRLAFLKASELSAKAHIKAGDEFLAANRYDEAYLEYQAAMVMDPSQDRAKQQLELLEKYIKSQQFFAEGAAFEKENKIREAVRSYQRAVSLNAANKEAAEALVRLLKTKKTKTEGFELNLKSNKPITLKFKDAKTKDVFNIITQLSGINFVFDDGLKDASITIYLENATFQQAMDIICGMHKLGRKILNENTVIIYQKTPDKVKQYEDLYVQTFFLNKLDAKKAVNLIRTMLQVKKIYVNEEMNTLVIRDTADVIDVARRILEANDVPDAEVVLEVEVIELSKKNAESFGLALNRYAVDMHLTGPSGKFLNSTFVSTDTVAASGTATVNTNTGNTANVATSLSRSDTSQLVNLFRWGDYNGYITVPNATFNFGKSLGNAETLSNPKIRVKNREKAKFNVGTRVPITTTSSNGVGNYNVNVQYVDVGVKLNAEPTIQLNNDVNIKVGLEVSSILSKEKVGTDGNTTVATIGTRNMDTVLSLKDGETSVIGGLIQNTQNKATQKVWLLGDIPVIGQLFSNQDNSGDKTELILAITPRIVRGITVSDPEIAAFWSGLEDDPSTAKQYNSFTQEPEFAQPAKPAKPQEAQPQSAVKPQEKATAQSQPAVQTPQPAVLPAPPLVQPMPQPAGAAEPQPKTEALLPGQSAAKPPVTSAALPAPATPVAELKPVPDGQPPTASAATAAPELSAAVPQDQQAASAAPRTAVTAPLPLKKVTLKIVAPVKVKPGEQFAAEVVAEDAVDLYAAPMTLVFDPALLEFMTLNEGDFFKTADKQSTFSTKIDNQAGQLTVKMARDDAAAGFTGTGRLFSALFRAKNRGPASIGFLGVKLAGKAGRAMESIPYNAVVEVK